MIFYFAMGGKINSYEDSPFRRSAARLKAYFKGFNYILEQKLSDGELLDDVPVSFQMN